MNRGKAKIHDHAEIPNFGHLILSTNTTEAFTPSDVLEWKAHLILVQLVTAVGDAAAFQSRLAPRGRIMLKIQASSALRVCQQAKRAVNSDFRGLPFSNKC